MVAEQFHLAGLRVDLHVGDGACVRPPDSRGIYGSVTHDWSAHLSDPACQLFEGHFQLRIGLGTDYAILVLNVACIHFPELGSSPDHLLLDIFCCTTGCQTRSECSPTSVRLSSKANGVRVDYCGVHVLRADAEDLGGLHCDRRPRTSNVGGTFEEIDGPVIVDADGAGRGLADVEPEAQSHAASPGLRPPAERCSGDGSLSLP